MLFILKERKATTRRLTKRKLGSRVGTVQTRHTQDEQEWWPPGLLRPGASLPQGSAVFTLGKQESEKRERTHSLRRPTTPRGLLATRREGVHPLPALQG